MNKKELSNEMLFFVYLLEKYAEYKGTSATEKLKLFDQIHLTDYIKQMYPMYHTERLENAFSDIDSKTEMKLSLLPTCSKSTKSGQGK